MKPGVMTGVRSRDEGSPRHGDQVRDLRRWHDAGYRPAIDPYYHNDREGRGEGSGLTDLARSGQQYPCPHTDGRGPMATARR
jgi:hypothetical protein